MDVGFEMNFGVGDLNLSIVAGNFSDKPGGAVCGVVFELVWRNKPNAIDYRSVF